ncbi:MAG: thiamine-phosphate kinase [Polyangiales bacterium]
MSASSEARRLAMLREVFGALPEPDVGVGDDAAVLHDPRPLVVTVDAAVEGVHFRRDLLSLDAASARACEAAMSDVAAMGATLDGAGCGLLLAWTLPRGLADDDMLALARGADRAARRVGTRVVGGNLSAGPALTLTTTVLGRANGAPLRRAGARVGDAVAVSGPMGLAARGLRALLAGEDAADARAAAQAWRTPRARLDLSAALARHAHACIDVSDGLALDAARLAEASSVGIDLDLTALRALVPDDVRDDEILHGGEDYELLATGPASQFPAGWFIVGAVTSGAGVWLRAADRREPLSPRGWDHFSAT